jgi:ATP-dependent DNA helicase RecG
MKEKELLQIIGNGENECVEFKEHFTKEVITALNAFVNTSGGSVIIGVSNKGRITGITISSETIQTWINEIKQKTEPSIVPMVFEFEIEGKNSIVLSVQEFPVKPVSYQGKYYKRVKNANHQLSVSEITNLHLQSVNISWDAYPYPNSSINSLNFEKVLSFIEKVNTTGRFKLENDPVKALEKLCLIKDGIPTNAAMILFSKDNLRYNVHIGRFKSPSLIVNDKMINGNLYDVIEESMQFIISSIKFAFEITGRTTQRTEIPEYPLNAVRELLLNALVHRNYQSPIDVQIKIFDQSISFFNPSGLYGDLTIEDLNTDSYRASTRNKMIAEALYLTNDIEKYGSGYIRIRKAIAEYPTMIFSYREIANGYLAEFSYSVQKTTINPENVTVNPENVTVNPENVTVNPENVTVNPENVTVNPENVTVNPKSNSIKGQIRLSGIIASIKENPQISLSTLAQKYGVTERTIKRDIELLKGDNKIIRIGADKTGAWQVLD